MTNQELFYFTGKCLALDENPGFRNEIIRYCQSDLIDWERFVSLCSNHFILQVIFLKFRTHDLIRFLPEKLAEHLIEIYNLNKTRNNQILSQIESITGLLNKNDIFPVYLKGAAYLLDGLFSKIGERILGDIDFWVPEEDYLRTAKILETNGYLKVNKIFDYEIIEEMKHYPRLYHPDFVAVVEVHRIPVHEELLSWFSLEQINCERKPVDRHSGCYVLSDRHKIIHNFIHSQLHNEGNLFGLVSLREVYDLCLLSKRCPLAATLDAIKPKRKAIAYFNLSKTILGLDNTFFSKKNFSGYSLKKRHALNLNSVLFYKMSGSIIFISQRIFVGYIGLIAGALFSGKKRQYIRSRVLDRNWYTNHVKFYSRFFMRNR